MKAGRPSERNKGKTPTQLAIEVVQEKDKSLKSKRININISEEMRKLAKVKTAEDDTTISDLLRDYLDEYVNDLSHLAISKELYEQVKLKAASEGMELNELAAKLFGEYMNK